MKVWWIAWVVGAFAFAGCGTDGTSSGAPGGAAGIGGAGGIDGAVGTGGAAGSGGGAGMTGAWCAEKCAETQYCDGGACEGQGICEDRPMICTLEINPVCGCDGNTYGNPCEAANAGVRVDFDGACD